MIAVAPSLMLLGYPFVLWVLGYHVAALAVGFYALFSIPSVVQMFYLSIQGREWPKITGDSDIYWGGKRK